jgi:hypothetical protein
MRQYPLDISATYSEGGISATGRLDLLATPQASTLTTLTIVSSTSVLLAGDSLALKALAVYADQSLKTVAAVWQVDHEAVQITQSGVLTVGSFTVDGPVLVSASFTEAGITTVAEFQMQLRQAAFASPLQLEVEATGPRNRYGLSAWVRLPVNALPLSRNAVSPDATGRGEYKMYVVALAPGGAGQSLGFVLNRNKEWQALSSPLPEYLSGVVDSRDYLVTIFDQVDSRLIAGTAIYIGFGTSDTEMLAQGRYRMLQVL